MQVTFVHTSQPQEVPSDRVPDDMALGTQEREILIARTVAGLRYMADYIENSDPACLEIPTSCTLIVYGKEAGEHAQHGYEATEPLAFSIFEGGELGGGWEQFYLHKHEGPLPYEDVRGDLGGFDPDEPAQGNAS